MKVVFASNYFNHHQRPFSEAMAKLCDFTFIETAVMSRERKNLGWGEAALPPYVKQTYRSTQAHDECMKLIAEADVVIAGSAPEEMMRARIHSGKLLFRYSERPLKKGFQPIKYVPRLLIWRWRNPMRKPIYMLCASAFTAADYSKFGLFHNRCYKWGYFPETNHYDLNALFAKKQRGIPHILWCGRFLELKHPDDVICITERLKTAGYCFNLDFIGEGKLQPQLEQMIQEKNLGDCVHLLGAMTPEQVRTHMEQSNIYLFTSGRYEGWGAVLNESMNSGCAVVASHAIGSVPFLMKDGENGLIYESGNTDMLYEKVKYLLDRPEEQERLGKAAYQTIIDAWNAEEAAKRLVALSEQLLQGEKFLKLYAAGPCSSAKYIGDDWFIHEK